MKSFELVVVIDPRLSQDDAKAASKKVEQLLDGAIKDSDDM
jgi:hypothetical protein